MRIIAVVLAFTAFCVHAAPFAYIPAFGSNTVTIIDIATQSVVARRAVGNSPSGVAISPDGTRVFVANSGDNTVTVMTATGVVLGTIPVGAGPEAAAYDRASDRVYVTNGIDGTVTAIDASTLTAVATVAVGNAPRGIVVNPASASSRVYVANSADGTISVLDSSLALATTIALPPGSQPIGLALDPSGSMLFAANFNSSTVDRFATATNAPFGAFTLPPGSGPTDVVVDHAGAHVYVTASGSDSVVGFDLPAGTQSFSKAFAGGSLPWGIDIDADDTLLYVPLDGIGVLDAVQTASPFGVVKTYGIDLNPAPIGRFIGPGTPTAPLAVSAVAGNGEVTVSFSPPASDGGTAVTSYTVTCGAQSASAAGGPIVVSGLPNGAAVSCAVVASNAMGAGPASAPAGPVTPAGSSIGARDVPALSRWALVFMALLLAALGVVRGRRRR